MWRGLSCVKVAGRRRKSPQKKKKRAQRPTDHRMHLNWFIKAPRSTLLPPGHLPPLASPFAAGCVSPSLAPVSPPSFPPTSTSHSRTTLWRATTHAELLFACTGRYIQPPIARTYTADVTGDILLIMPTQRRAWCEMRYR